MYERFSDQARNAVRGAQEEARQLGHRQIGTEHLLLGLLGVLALDEGTARSALDLLAIDPEPARQEVLARAGRGPGAPPGHIPFTRGCQKVLGYALNEAVRARHQYIGAEHILLALLRDRDGIAGKALRGLGADLEAARGFVAGLVEATGLPEGVIIKPRASRRIGQRRGHPAKADGAGDAEPPDRV